MLYSLSQKKDPNIILVTHSNYYFFFCQGSCSPEDDSSLKKNTYHTE